MLGQVKQATINGANLAILESCTYTLKTKVVSATPPTQINEVCVNTVVGSGNIARTSTEKCDTADITINQPVNSFCNSLSVTWNGQQVVAGQDITTNLPTTINFSTNWGGNQIQCGLYKSNFPADQTGSLVGNLIPTGIGSFTINNPGVYWVKCIVDGIMPGGQNYNINSCATDFSFAQAPAPYIDLELEKFYIDGTTASKTFNSGDYVGFKLVVWNHGNT